VLSLEKQVCARIGIRLRARLGFLLEFRIRWVVGLGVTDENCDGYAGCGLDVECDGREDNLEFGSRFRRCTECTGLDQDIQVAGALSNWTLPVAAVVLPGALDCQVLEEALMMSPAAAALRIFEAKAVVAKTWIGKGCRRIRYPCREEL